jgi:hypothetical protein
MTTGLDRQTKNDEVVRTDAAGSGGAALIVGGRPSLPTKADFQIRLQPDRRV